MQDWTTADRRMEEPQKPVAVRVFVDADACPVKEETYRVAERYGLHVYVVANAFYYRAAGRNVSHSVAIPRKRRS